MPASILGIMFGLGWPGSTINQHPISDWLAVIGLATGAVGIVLIFWHPKWVRPTWLRGPMGD